MIAMQFPSEIIVGDETLTMRRYNPALDDAAGIQIVNGKRVLNTFEEFEIACNVQPVTGDDLIQDPEGVRYDDQYYIWVWDSSEQPLPNDFVLREGDWYLVMAATGWGSFTQARLQRIDVGQFRALVF